MRFEHIDIMNQGFSQDNNSENNIHKKDTEEVLIYLYHALRHYILV